MNDTRCDVLVIGGGPAGMAAACAAREAGARTVLVDREERLGGILKQCIHDGFGILRYSQRLTGPEYARMDVSTIRRNGPECRTDTSVFAISRGNRGRWIAGMVSPSRGIEEISCGSVILAAGCRERTDRQVFLHGDRPAGIFTAGQAQRLVNINGIMPGRRVVILGSGDIGLIMARRMTLEGASVIGVYEVKPVPSGLSRNIALCLEDWDIPLHLNSTVTEVQGERRVCAVTVRPVAPDGHMLPGHAKRVECDCLILSVGLVPEVDLLRPLGIEMDQRTGSPPVDQHRESLLPGLFVCGNALLVYDLVDYVSQCGRLAGLRAASRATAVAAGEATGNTTGIPGGNAAGNLGAMETDRAAVELSSGIAVCVPQHLDLNTAAPPNFFFRPSCNMDRARFSVIVEPEKRPVYTRRLEFPRPQVMERIDLPLAAWEQIRRGNGSIRLALEEE